MPDEDHRRDGTSEQPDVRRGDRQELVRCGAEQDGVQLRHYADPWPVAGTRAERRARRAVLVWAAVSVLSGLGFLAAYLFWPSEYVPPGEDGHLVYELYTPMLGLTLGLALLALSVMLIVYIRRFMPHEVAVQERHDEPSPGGGPGRRGRDPGRLRAAGGADQEVVDGAGARCRGRVTGLGAGVLTVGGFVEDPVDRPRDPDSLWHTTWASPDGEPVYLRQDVGDPHEVVLVQPGDLEASSMVSVMPFRESERDHPVAGADDRKRVGGGLQRGVRSRTADDTERPRCVGLDRHVLAQQGQLRRDLGPHRARSELELVCGRPVCPRGRSPGRTGCRQAGGELSAACAKVYPVVRMRR